jgi:PLP dependent protein
VAGESSKFGFQPGTLATEVAQMATLHRLQLDGLMTIAPLAPDAESSRRHFAQLRELRDTLEAEFHLSLPHLSMGMSGDYRVAVEEGATLVRVGTAIFGPRSGKGWRPGESAATLHD